MPKRRLGKGIDALLQGRDLEQLSNMGSVLHVDIDNLEPNPRQPRHRFNDDALEELAASIREKGIIQPILAEDHGDGTYTIVAGERRFRAAKLAGLTEVPVIPQDFTEDEKLEIALIENLQREDLNPIDEALAFDSAIRTAGLTQEQLANRLGKSRPAIANALRLLKLDSAMQDALASGAISAGHARALLAESDPDARQSLFKRILSEGLSVREAEAGGRPPDPTPQSDAGQPGAPAADVSIPEESDRVDLPGEAGPSKAGQKKKPAEDPRSPELRRLEDRLVEQLGTRVYIRGNDSEGRIEVSYYSTDDLNDLANKLGLPPE